MLTFWRTVLSLRLSTQVLIKANGYYNNAMLAAHMCYSAHSLLASQSRLSSPCLLTQGHQPLGTKQMRGHPQRPAPLHQPCCFRVVSISASHCIEPSSFHLNHSNYSHVKYRICHQQNTPAWLSGTASHSYYII